MATLLITQSGRLNSKKQFNLPLAEWKIEMSLWRETMAETARAVAFLSRIPVSDRYFVGHDGRLSETVSAFAAAGLVIALPSALTLLLLASGRGAPMLVALIAILLTIAVTGALHEDGLSDTADGLGGGRDKEAALSIMKDSRIGTYGAVALILSIALRATALATIVEGTSPASAAGLVLATAALSRTALVWHWANLPPARANGVASAAGIPSPRAAAICYGSGAAAFLLFGLDGAAFPSLLGAAAAMVVVVLIFTRRVRQKLEGHTGDTLGASQQLAEIALLVSLAFLI